MEFCVVATIGSADDLANLVQQTLMCGVMLFKVRESIAAQKALFATEMHICELNQAGHLLGEPCTAVSPRQLMAKRVQGVHQDPMLVVHCLDADGLATMRGNAGHGSPFLNT
jgi:hypothetical protein